jgi:hypothetical protein
VFLSSLDVECHCSVCPNPVACLTTLMEKAAHNEEGVDIMRTKTTTYEKNRISRAVILQIFPRRCLLWRTRGFRRGPPQVFRQGHSSDELAQGGLQCGCYMAWNK